VRHIVQTGTGISNELPLIGDLARLIGRPLGAAISGLFDSYRPELHYMRGPGPKWHEKHGVAAAQSASRRPRPQVLRD
jgi:hypothetical protein